MKYKQFASLTIPSVALAMAIGSSSCAAKPSSKWNLPSELLHREDGASLSSDEEIRAALEKSFLTKPQGNSKDAGIEREVKLALALNSTLIGSDVSAWVDKGVVYLAGNVDSKEKQRLASEIAASSSKKFLVVRNGIHIEGHG